MDTYKLHLTDGTVKYFTTSTSSGDLSDEDIANQACDAGIIPYPSSLKSSEHWPAFDINDTTGATFHLMGRFEVPKGVEKVKDFQGNTVGFKYPDGSTYMIQVVLERTSPNGEDVEDMGSVDCENIGILGFGELDERDIRIEEEEEG